jgi:hypothetical protein
MVKGDGDDIIIDRHLLESSTLELMKQLLLTAVWLFVIERAIAQGTVAFINLNNPAGLNAPVYESNRITPLSGQQFMAELLAGPSTHTRFKHC